MGKANRKLLDVFSSLRSSRLKSGFTLVELIVIIGILAALSLVALSANTSTFWRARNSRRISDMEQIRNALEAYRADHATLGYPAVLGFETALKPNYLRIIPTGPQNLNYTYGRDNNDPTNLYKYCICSPMEGIPADIPTSQCSINSWTPPTGYQSYCVAN